MLSRFYSYFLNIFLKGNLSLVKTDLLSPPDKHLLMAYHLFLKLVNIPSVREILPFVHKSAFNFIFIVVNCKISFLMIRRTFEIAVTQKLEFVGPYSPFIYLISRGFNHETFFPLWTCGLCFQSVEYDSEKVSKVVFEKQWIKKKCYKMSTYKYFEM